MSVQKPGSSPGSEPVKRPFGLILCSSGAAGMIDVIAYLLFGNVFVANMTGNTVLMGSALVARDWPLAVRHLFPIVGFVLGVLFGKLVRSSRLEKVIGPVFSAALCFLGSSGILAMTVLASPQFWLWVIPLLSFSMGMQNVAWTHVGSQSVNTTFITGDLAKLGEAIANLISKPRGSREEAGGSVRVLSLLWAVYLLGAICGSVLALQLQRTSLLIPSALLALLSISLMRPASE